MTKRAAAFELTADVGSAITPEYLDGSADVALDDFRRPISDLIVDPEGILALQSAVTSQFAPGDNESDAWLAARLHNLLRLNRRQASRHGFWRWMAIEKMRAYV